ncbi:hypothetical protein C8Q78DRAFT_985690, partial [Trametes maxima]
QHMSLFSRLKAENMSGDEAVMNENGLKKKRPYCFNIIDASWEGAAWKRFVRSLDAMYVEDRGDRGGNAPRVRIEPNPPRTEKRVAPKGLPRNCYDAEWVAKQKPHFLESLDIQDHDYDFSLIQ